MWLLDGNVLVALTVSSHVHHARAAAWLRRVAARPFAVCSVTEGTLLRVAMSPAVGLGAREAWKVLDALRAFPGYEFWDAGFSYVELNSPLILGAAQVTDAWLAELARRKGAKLATFDKGLALAHPDVADLIP